MSYELTENEAVIVTDSESTISREELERECFSLEESKKKLLAKAHRHYHPEIS